MADASYQPKVYRKQGGDELVVAEGGVITVESGGSIAVESGGSITLPDQNIQVADLALADGKLIIGSAAGAGAAKTPSGDVTMNREGVTVIGAKKVTAAMIAAAAGTVLVGTKTSGDVTALDTSAAGAVAIGQGAGETLAAHALSGDVTMAATGVVTIGAGRITAAMLANGAGLAALIAAGLGASAAYPKTTNGVQTPLAGDAAARIVLIVAVVTEVFADAGGNQPVFAIGETDTATKFTNGAAFVDAALNSVKVFAGTLTATKALIVTATQAVGAGTGAISFTVLVLPAAV